MKKKYISLILLFAHLFYTQCNTPQPGDPLWNILAQTQTSQCTTTSKLDEISIDFSGVFTALETINNLLTTDISKLEEIAIVTVDPFISPLIAIESKLEIAQNLIQPIQSTADLLDNCIGIPITQADVGTTGYSITTGGKYFLAENITFSPASGIPAIGINADNVTLDLSGFTITQGNNQTGVIGIRVSAGRSDITIQNGTIRNTVGQGATIDPPFTNVNIKDLSVLNAGVGPGSGSPVAVDGMRCGDNNAASNNLLIKNCTIDGCQDEGIDIRRVSNIVIQNCNFTGARGDAGLVLRNQCFNAYILNCIFYDNIASGFLIGVNSDNTSGENILISNCKAFNNGTDGFEILGPNNPAKLTIVNCQSFNNGQYGINLEGYTGTFTTKPVRECVVAYNYIANNASDGIRLDKSIVDNNFILRNTLVENGGNSINNAVGAVNSFLGNYAFKSSGTNYVSGGSTINATTVNTNSAFSTQPVFWRNINATP